MNKGIILVGTERDIDLAIAKLHQSMREEKEFKVDIMVERLK